MSNIYLNVRKSQVCLCGVKLLLPQSRAFYIKRAYEILFSPYLNILNLSSGIVKYLNMEKKEFRKLF